MTLYFLGGGNMATAIIAGLRQSQWHAPICVIERNDTKRQQLSQQWGIHTAEILPELRADDVLILAVKPQDMAQACANIAHNGALILSIAAGLSIATLSRFLHGATRIIRIMPNTPARIGLGISGLFAPENAQKSDRECAENIMRSCGQTLWLAHEDDIHAITAVSGSGSAYVFYLLHALQNAAESLGFNHAQAQQLSLNTFKGAVALAEQSPDSFLTLQQQVCSKGGTTEAAIQSFENHRLSEYLGIGVHAAAQRSHALSADLDASPSFRQPEESTHEQSHDAH